MSKRQKILRKLSLAIRAARGAKYPPDKIYPDGKWFRPPELNQARIDRWLFRARQHGINVKTPGLLEPHRIIITGR